MLHPFILGSIQHRDAADAQFADSGREGGLSAYCAEEGGPAGGDGGGVQEGEVEVEEGGGRASGGEVGVGGGGGGGGGGRRGAGRVGETHYGLFDWCRRGPENSGSLGLARG